MSFLIILLPNVTSSLKNFLTIYLFYLGLAMYPLVIFFNQYSATTMYLPLFVSNYNSRERKPKGRSQDAMTKTKADGAGKKAPKTTISFTTNTTAIMTIVYTEYTNDIYNDRVGGIYYGCTCLQLSTFFDT